MCDNKFLNLSDAIMSLKVALSRLKSLDGLQLTGFNAVALEVDALAHKADKRFRQLSTQAESEFASADLDKEAKQFIRNCGGLTDPKEIEKYNKKRKEKKAGKKATSITVRSG